MRVRASAKLAQSLDRGWTLPASWYTDPAVHREEKNRIFHRAWQYAGLTDDLRNHGDFLTYQAGDVPILVVKDAKGSLQAYINVCRHRGSVLVNQERGRRKSIQCGYHAWTYALDGTLLAAPGENGEPEFDRADFSLIPAQVDTWGPFVFVNPDEGARPLAEYLGPLPQMVSDTGLDLRGIRLARRDTYDIAANWKVVLDNYLECYHCPTAHPAFSHLIDLDQYEIQEFPYFSAQSGPVLANAREGREGLYEIGPGVESGFYAYFWPNFTLNIYPGPGNVSLNLILPIDADHTRVIYEYCFVDSVDEAAVDEFHAFLDQVQREDIALCESVQRGLHSGFVDQGRLLLSRESALRHFQKLVYRSLTQ
jgi:choline monooxygenase